MSPGANARLALACAALCAAGCRTPGAWQAEVARQRALSFDLLACKRGMLDASKGREKLLMEKNAVDAERGELVKQIESERAGVTVLRDALEKERVARMLKDEEIDRLTSAYQALSEALSAEQKSGQVEIERLRSRVAVRAFEKTLFNPGSTELKADGKKVLAKVAAGLKGVSDGQIQVEGHTDNVPIKSSRFATNLDLSAARAVAVAKYLAANGAPEKLLAAAGYGDHEPIASNADAQGRQRNRRIEISLEPPRAD
ncbi:MAG TPA: OmpA family protein [Myxococcota bacterium]|nr:OmpA family protein [Myxococcota bacterium]